MVIRGRDCAANSWVKDAARANDGARVMDAERAGCWSSQPKNSADADLEKPALRAQISASRPKPVTILGMGSPLVTPQWLTVAHLGCSVNRLVNAAASRRTCA